MTTTTKTIREIQYLGPDGQPLEYVPNSANPNGNGPPQVHPRLHGNQNYDQLQGDQGYGNVGGNGGGHYHPQGVYPQSSGDNGGGGHYEQEGVNNYQPGANHPYAEYPHRPPTPPSPSDRSNSPPPQHREPGKKIITFSLSYFVAFILLYISLFSMFIFIFLSYIKQTSLHV